MRIRKEVVIFLAIFVIGIVSRWLLASKDFTHVDEVLYAIGTFNYSIQDGTPPSPGYFLYIMSARLLNFITRNPYSSLIFLSIFYSGLIAATLYYFGRRLKDQVTGIVTALLFLSSPVFWYKGITIFGYLNSGFFTLLTALLCYFIICEKREDLALWLGLSFGILLGIRPQELIVLLPLYIFALCHLKPTKVIYSLLIFALTCFLWFVPLIAMAGGVKEYIGMLKYGSVYLMDDSILSGNIMAKLGNHLIRLGLYFIRIYFLGLVVLIYYIGRFFYLPNFISDKKVQFFAVWIFPCLIYNIFIQFGEVGHGMSWALGFFLIIGEAIIALSQDLVEMLKLLAKHLSHNIQKIAQARVFKNTICAIVVLPVMGVNLFMFFYDFDKADMMPFYSFKEYTQSNYNYVAKKNQYLTSKIGFIKDNLSKEKSVIVTTGEFVEALMYHFPSLIVIYPDIVWRNGKTAFWQYQNYKCTHYKNRKDFIIPAGFTRVIVFDDKLIPYINTKERVCYYEINNSYKIATVELKEGRKIDFEYNSIIIK